MGSQLRAGIAFSVLMATSSLMALIFTVPAPVLYAIGEERGAWIAQGMSNAASLAIILGGPLAGWLNRRWNTRSLLLPSLLVYGIVGPLVLVIRSSYLLLASRFVLGFCAAVAVSASIAMISARYTGTQRLRLLGYQGGIASVAGLATLWIAGGMASSGGWRAPFILYGLGAVLFALAAPTLRNNVEPPAMPSAECDPDPGAWRTLAPLWAFYLAVILLFGASFSTGLQLSFKLGEHGIVDPAAQRNVILFGSFMNAVGSGVYGLVVARLGARLTFVAGIAALAGGALLIGSAATAVPIGAGAALMGTGGGLLGPSLIGRLVDRVSDSERAGAVGLFYSCIFIGEFLNPLFMQPVRGAYGSDVAFLALGGLLLIGVLWANVASRSWSAGNPAALAPP